MSSAVLQAGAEGTQSPEFQKLFYWNMSEYPYLSSEKDFLPNGKQTIKEENVRMKAKVAIYILFS